MRLTTRPADSRPLERAGIQSIRLRAWAGAGILVVLALIYQLDRATGSAPVQHLYYIPIVIAGLYFGRAGGLMTAFTAVVLYHSTNPQLLTFQYEHWDLLQIGVFVAIALITAKVTGDARRLRLLAMTDDLTGLHNLRSFEAELGVMVRATSAKAAPIALLVLDLDRLKSLNDAHGHLCGAEAVRTVGHVIAAWLPPGGAACRYGGDEFVVALPDCTEAQATALADRLRQQVHAAAPRLAGIDFPAGTLSISIGVASRAFETRHMMDDSAEALFRLADAALYRAKSGGRNRIHLSRDTAELELTS